VSVVLAILIMLPIPGRCQTLGDALNRASEALAAGDFETAEALYRRLVVANPGLADAYEGLAQALAGLGRNLEAAAIRSQLGEGWVSAGRYELAVEEFEKALALAPNQAILHAQIGRVFLLDKANARALEHLERAAALGDASPKTRTYLGSALWECGRLENSEEVFRSAVRGGSTAALFQLQRLLLWQGRYEEALAVLDKLLPVAGGSADVLMDLARALEGVGRVDEAIGAYRRLIEIDPEGSKLQHYRLALLLIRSGRREDGQKEMEIYRRLSSRDREITHQMNLQHARLDRAWELLREGKVEAAEEIFSDLPATGDSLRGLALVRSHQGRHAEAVTILERAVLIAPERPELRLLLAEERVAIESQP
jgi:tetratricopeptide (TPR) repeat protein